MAPCRKEIAGEISHELPPTPMTPQPRSPKDRPWCFRNGIQGSEKPTNYFKGVQKYHPDNLDWQVQDSLSLSFPGWNLGAFSSFDQAEPSMFTLS